MKILIIGGTGNISWRLADIVAKAGLDVTLFNRGGDSGKVRRPVPAGCKVLAGDIRNIEATDTLLGSGAYDLVFDFLCFNAAQAEQAIQYFAHRAAHYVFISSTAIYDRAVAALPLTEASPILSSGWDYALAKAAAERVFIEAHEKQGFPVTIIRPGHTYDVVIPEALGNGDWTNAWRLLNGKPIVIHGDGTSLWTLTHAIDFAHALFEFAKSPTGPGQAYHITSSEIYTWRQIAAVLCEALGASEPKACFRTTQQIYEASPYYGNSMKGHKMWCDVYDNTKFRSAYPSWNAHISLAGGIKKSLAIYRSNPKLMVPNPQLDEFLDSLCAAGPQACNIIP